MKPIQRSIGTITDFCEKPTLKSSATLTNDVAQKSVETMTDAAGVNIRCHDEDQEDSDSDDSTEDEDEDWLPPVDESDDVMTVKIQLVNCKYNRHTGFMCQAMI